MDWWYSNFCSSQRLEGMNSRVNLVRGWIVTRSTENAVVLVACVREWAVARREHASWEMWRVPWGHGQPHFSLFCDICSGFCSVLFYNNHGLGVVVGRNTPRGTRGMSYRSRECSGPYHKQTTCRLIYRKCIRKDPTDDLRLAPHAHHIPTLPDHQINTKCAKNPDMLTESKVIPSQIRALSNCLDVNGRRFC